jgi:hypothetical protein
MFLGLRVDNKDDDLLALAIVSVNSPSSASTFDISNPEGPGSALPVATSIINLNYYY